MDCLPNPQFCFDFLLWSKTYSNKLAQALQIGIFHRLASLRDVVRLVYTHYGVQFTLLHNGLH